MYYPKQLPYLFDNKFSENVEYKEYLIDILKNCCFCIWSMNSKKIVNETIYNYILPDACIDIVIDFTNKTIFFAGFSKETIPFELNKKIEFLGVRFKPGIFNAIYDIPADKIMDKEIPFNNIEKEFDLYNIFKIKDTKNRIEYLKKYLIKKQNQIKYYKMIYLIDILYKDPKDKVVLNIASSFGYHRRQLYRVFKRTYGISPKILLNILRLHLSLTLLEEGKSIDEIMATCDFYDQSHFIKEIKRYTGFSPIELLDKYKI